MTLPLSGLRIVAVEQYGAGPYGTQHLADLGAEVIKIENAKTGGDMSRGVGPYFLGEGDGEFYQAMNRNKKSLTLDLKHPDSRAVFHKLVATADGLMGNLRGDQPEKLGLTYADLRHVNPKIVCAHLSAYGRDGDRKGWPGYDYLMQAESGFLSLTGEPGGPPARFGLSMVDFMTGVTCAFALVSSIMQARQTGEGRDVDVSLYDVAMHQLSYPAVWYLNSGLKTTRVARSGHPYIVPSQLYRTKDGWIFLMCQTQRFWEILCDKIGRPDLAANPRYRGYADRNQHRDELTEILDAELSKRGTDEWVAHFKGEVPCGPVYDIAQALENPYFVERGGYQLADHPDKPGGRIKLMNTPVRLAEEIPARRAPKLGEHTDELLGELGYTEAEIAQFRKHGAV